jgi:integrase
VIDLPATLTKTGVGREVVITPRLDAILEMRLTLQRMTRELKPEDDLPCHLHPFGNEIGEPVKGFKTAWRLTCRRAEIVGLHFHDLRREAGSQLLESGASLTDVRDYLGHTSVTQTNTYLASSTQRLREALSKPTTARTNLAQPPQAVAEAEQPVTVTH